MKLLDSFHISMFNIKPSNTENLNITKISFHEVSSIFMIDDCEPYITSQEIAQYCSSAFQAKIDPCLEKSYIAPGEKFIFIEIRTNDLDKVNISDSDKVTWYLVQRDFNYSPT